MLRKIHLLCQRRLFLPRDFGVSRELSGFNGSFFRREQAPALLLTVNSALLIIGFRASTPGLFSGDHTGSPLLYYFKSSCSVQRFLGFIGYEFRATTQGRPYFIFGHSEAYPKFQITHCELRIFFGTLRTAFPNGVVFLQRNS